MRDVHGLPQHRQGDECQGPETETDETEEVEDAVEDAGDDDKG